VAHCLIYTDRSQILSFRAFSTPRIYVILDEVAGGLDMDVERAVYVRGLRAMLACDQSDGYLKQRAKYRAILIKDGERL
jgi:hypothetical protein